MPGKETETRQKMPFIEQGTFAPMDYLKQVAVARKMAQALVKQVGSDYDPSSCYVEKQSFHPDDWYLWTVAVRSASAGTWTVWTLNLSTCSLQIGRYCLSPRDAISAMNSKRG